MAREPIVILGTGLAGYNTARELRRLEAGKRLALTLVTRDDGRFYSKPDLSVALARGKAPDEIPLADAGEMAAQLDATILTHAPVARIDRAARKVVLEDGRGLAYGRVVLALGAEPVRPPLAGDAAGEVLSVNDLDGYRRFRERLDGHERVAILGAGLIGCEFANDLAATGHRVTVADPAPWPLARFLPEAAGRRLERELAALGVTWRFGVTAERVDRVDGALALRLSDGSTIAADVALSAVGLRPRTALAAEAGLATGRGILVDRLLRTSDPAIHALGDCAEVLPEGAPGEPGREGLVLPFVMPLVQGARALARTLAGEPTPVRYPAMPVAVKTPAHPVVVAPPAPGAEGAWEVAEDEGGVRALFRAPDGRLLGFALTGAHVKERPALARELPPLLP